MLAHSIHYLPMTTPKLHIHFENSELSAQLEVAEEARRDTDTFDTLEELFPQNYRGVAN